MTAWEELDVRGLRAAILAGERTVRASLEECLERIAALDPELNAFLWVDREGARRRAAALDEALASGATPGPLFGVPVAIKANLCLEGAPSSCASRMLEDYRAPYTATVVERLLAAGAIPVGMTNMDEFAMGSSGENSAFGPTRNPWDTERIPGGSSSGSAAAVGAGLVPLALGSDTGGSVRQPAAMCGVQGFKPTYGRLPRYGLIAFGSSLDQVSPLARSVEDLELALSVLAGKDPRDSTSLDEPAPTSESRDDLSALRLGVPAGCLEEVDAPVRAAFEAALEEARALGAEIAEVSLEHTGLAIATYYVVANAEASSNLARYDGVRYGARTEGDGSLQGMFAATRDAGFGPEVKRRILLGTYVLSSGYYDAWYGRALKVRRLCGEDYQRAFADVDLIATPTAPTAAFRLGEKADDPLAMYLSDVFTVPASLAGLPGLSTPMGFDGELPLGLQLIGPAGADARVLSAGRVLAGRLASERRPGVWAGKVGS